MVVCGLCCEIYVNACNERFSFFDAVLNLGRLVLEQVRNVLCFIW